MLIFLAFLLGIVATTAVLWIITGSSKNDKRRVRDAIKDIELIGSVKYRFTKVTEITERQMDLIASTERPSANASHSRHKNSILGELKALEQEKIDIFKSILSDGIDPQLSVSVDGQPQNMRMSEAVALFEGGDTSNPHIPQQKTESKSPRTNGLKLIHSRENSNEPSSPTVPGT